MKTSREKMGFYPSEDGNGPDGLDIMIKCATCGKWFQTVAFIKDGKAWGPFGDAEKIFPNCGSLTHVKTER